MYGSCLPMLIQMPLFIAYFEVLSNVIELRQATGSGSAIFRCRTLAHSAHPDHRQHVCYPDHHALSGHGPTQRKMMAFMMPIFMGSFLWHYASGLALYWGTSNMINLLIQLGINQSSIGKEMHEIAAKRAIKKSAASRQPFRESAKPHRTAAQSKRDGLIACPFSFHRERFSPREPAAELKAPCSPHRPDAFPCAHTSPGRAAATYQPIDVAIEHGERRGNQHRVVNLSVRRALLARGSTSAASPASRPSALFLQSPAAPSACRSPARPGSRSSPAPPPPHCPGDKRPRRHGSTGRSGSRCATKHRWRSVRVPQRSASSAHAAAHAPVPAWALPSRTIRECSADARITLRQFNVCHRSSLMIRSQNIVKWRPMFRGRDKLNGMN